MVEQKSGGSIVLIASMGGHNVTPGQKTSAYMASKAAIIGLAKALGVELAPYKIRCNSISPSYIETDMVRELAKHDPNLALYSNTIPPLGRIGTRNDLNPAIVYLLSDASSYTTGSDILITGALHAGRIEI